MNGQSNLPPAYDLHRSIPMAAPSVGSSQTETSMDYSEPLDGDSYLAASSVTAGVYTYTDATSTVHEMHLALLYLLSNPDEFQKALSTSPPRGATTLAEWNAEYEEQDDAATEYTDATTTPLPFVVFADDAEVVLPQAHTASQLFGIERIEGIELEAAAGVPALSQLFLRWLALMPGGDHLNIIDPPGLTVMRIAGGRYRVTAAHRVVWTWMNEFAAVSADETDEEDKLVIGDLVTMTVVDVFETDNNGKLLSYCPTFDNRAVRKTTQASESLRRGSAHIMSQLNFVAKSETAAKVNKAAAQLKRMSINAAKSMATSVKGKIDQQRAASPQRTDNVGVNEFQQALSEAEAATSAVDKNNAPEAEEESLEASPEKADQSPRPNPVVSKDENAGEI